MFYKEKALIEYANENNLKIVQLWVYGPTGEIAFCFLFNNKGHLKHMGYYEDNEWSWSISKLQQKV